MRPGQISIIMYRMWCIKVTWASCWTLCLITGWLPFSQPSVARLRCEHAGGRRWHSQRPCVQATVQKSCLLLPSGIRVHIWKVSPPPPPPKQCESSWAKEHKKDYLYTVLHNKVLFWRLDRGEKIWNFKIIQIRPAKCGSVLDLEYW